MQHEERGKQNLQDPQSDVHCMITFSASRTQTLRLGSMMGVYIVLLELGRGDQNSFNIHIVSESVLYVYEAFEENL
jgi:hypothetical protein